MKPKLLIIDRNQFGYHSDTYYYCKYLRDDFCVSYLCFDEDKNPLTLDRVTQVYVKQKKRLLLKWYLFFSAAYGLIKKENFDFVHVNYFKGCALLHLFVPNRRMMVDVRTASVLTQPWKRVLFNLLLKMEVRLFYNIGVISAGLARRLSLPPRHIITPLGSDIFSRTVKPQNALKFLYVGTFYNRNLHKTILGFHKFYRIYSQRIKTSYTIVGDGPSNELKKLKELVRNLGISDQVHFTGWIPQDKIQPFFDSHNVGISYIPITAYYNFQPPTKTYEYLLSGMPVIATNTHENGIVVNADNGVLIQDTPDAVFEGMQSIYSKLGRFDSRKIRSQASKYYTWENIVSSLSSHYKKLVAHNIKTGK
ncbi:Glycosyltransferase involved in cell wall bisynthesis [Nitrosomonas sp. Nm51]|uniref:glycosyltransferase n=1 Tax=Nitrosomonas sp. Nm51 TaxID=133720 RepID=UPI0008BE1FC5|nr:glycosyltransferase [Nitrosomonas sp. Nm51]SER72866.1 Glycosyltransferase involved in cell wall bisynthesis [Nitrosomonas sp. Nm51]